MYDTQKEHMKDGDLKKKKKKAWSNWKPLQVMESFARENKIYFGGTHICT